jgi:hypothetical protein
VAKVQERKPLLLWHILASQECLEVTEIVNLIKSRPLGSSLFSLFFFFLSLCQELSPEHTFLLLHTELWWLSRGKLCFWNPWRGSSVFIAPQEREYSNSLMMICTGVSLSVIFVRLNELNRNKNFCKELIAYFPLVQHEPHRKRLVQQLFYCCVCIRCSGNVFTEPLPSNDRVQIYRHIDWRKGFMNYAVEMGSRAII